MILTILKIIGIILGAIFLANLLKDIILYLLYAHNKNYRKLVDDTNYQNRLREEREYKQIEEEKRVHELTVLTNQWINTASYYFNYYERGALFPDYAYMLDLLTQKIINLLGGDYRKFRNEISEIMKTKDIKDVRSEELKSKLPENLTTKDFEKRNYTDDDINKILDEWEKRFREKDNKDE